MKKITEDLATTYQTGSGFAATKDDPTKETYLSPEQKLAREKDDAKLTERTQRRDIVCWSYGCTNAPRLWVREIQFDIKSDKVGADNAIVNTRDTEGPVPGFCLVHEVVGSKQLAEAVYLTRKEFQWGAPANRWFVIFTDGSKIGGDIHALDLGKGAWTVEEDYTYGGSH